MKGIFVFCLLAVASVCYGQERSKSAGQPGQYIPRPDPHIPIPVSQIPEVIVVNRSGGGQSVPPAPKLKQRTTATVSPKAVATPRPVVYRSPVPTPPPAAIAPAVAPGQPCVPPEETFFMNPTGYKILNGKCIIVGEKGDGYSAYRNRHVGPDLHQHFDLRVVRWTKIYAKADGIVVFADKTANGFGNMVIVWHVETPGHRDDLCSHDAHLEKIVVHLGQRVVKGQLIGYSGSTGRSTGPHLDFGFSRFFDNRKQDDGWHPQLIDPLPFDKVKQLYPWAW